jgi:hypothetical protein
VIFLDVDGPLITFSPRPAHRQPPSDGAPADQPGWCGNPLLDRLDPEDGRRLLALGCDLVWATTDFKLVAGPGYFLAFLNPSRGQPDPALTARLASDASVRYMSVRLSGWAGEIVDGHGQRPRKLATSTFA